MIEPTSKIECAYYCARAKASNSVSRWVRKGEWLRFRWSDEGGGWPQLDPCGDDGKAALSGKRWHAPPTQAELSWWQQMPMGITFDPATVEVFRITEVHETSFEAFAPITDGVTNRKKGF